MDDSPQMGKAPGRTSLPLEQQTRMVSALLECFRALHGGESVQLIETHISFVLLAGGFAYKIKKALNLGFLDFSTLARRRFYCDEELRLNRRLAPELYLAVIDITGSEAEPRLGGAGPAIEHALKMRAFPQQGLWDVQVRQGGLALRHMDEVAVQLCALHDGAAVSGPQTGFGLPAKVREPMLDNLDALSRMLRAEGERATIEGLRRWEAGAFQRLQPAFERRQQEGRVRECHGDLHLGNLTMIDGKPVMFDCLEFSEALRWTDVMSDVAFLAMDLQSHGRCDLSHRFVNGYFECAGDYDGALVLRYYIVHRALVRAKVAALKSDPSSEMLERYLDVASNQSRATQPTLLVTHGLSGSGKTTFTQGLVEVAGAIRVRADVERKRLHGLAAKQQSGSQLNAGLYAPAATRATYDRMNDAARAVLAGGFNAILDATFLRREQRRQARAVAAEMGVKFVLLDFRARKATLRRRVQQRATQGQDASEADVAVLDSQIASEEPLEPDEAGEAFTFDAELPLQRGVIAAAWAPLIKRLDAGHR
jgi:aminoglycoside phosphotransferase family enzyme/predicted kinase